MAATSPYTQNDYNALKFRPAQLPIADIFKGIQVKSAYWDLEASKIKNQYDTAMDLDLTLDENKEISKKYVNDAREQMKKLSSMDLTNPDVQQQSMELFKPLFSDKGIQYDDAITKLQKQVLIDANRFKNSKDGKGYADENLIDALSNFKDFKSTTSRSQLENIYDKAKNAKYVPYYDYQKEMLTLASKCGEVSTSKMSREGIYDVTVTESGLPSDKLESCLENLSPQANTQFQISGRVRYNKNYEALGNDIFRIYNQTVTNLEKTKAENDGRLSATGDKELPENMRNYYKSQNANLDIRIKNLKSSIDKINSGNYEEIIQDYDELAGMALKSNTISSVASSFYTKKYKEEFEVDPMELLLQKNINSSKKTLKEKYSISNNFNDISSEFSSGKQKILGDTYDVLLTKKGENTKMFNDQLKKLYSELRMATNSSTLKSMQSMGLQDFGESLEGDIDHDTEVFKFYNFLTGYYNKASEKDENGQIKNKEALDILRPYFNSMNTINMEQSVLDGLIKSADERAIKEVGNIEIILDDGNKLTGKDIEQLNNNTHPLYKIQGVAYSRSHPNVKIEPNANYYNIINKNGDIVLDGYTFNKTTTDYTEKVLKSRNDYLTEELSTQEKLFNINTTEEANRLKEEIATQAGISYTTADDLNQYVQIVNSPLDGSAYIRIFKPKENTLSDDKFYDEAKKGIAAIRGNSNVFDTKDKNVFRITNIEALDVTQGLLQNLHLYEQSIAVAKKEMQRNNTNSKVIVQGITQDGYTLQLVTAASGKLYIMDKEGKTIASFPESQITDAVTFFNSRIQGKTLNQ